MHYCDCLFFNDNFDICMKVSLCKKLSVVGFNAKHFYRQSTLLDLVSQEGHD